MKSILFLSFLFIPIKFCLAGEDIFLSLQRSASDIFPSVAGSESFYLPLSPEGVSSVLENSASLELQKSGGGLALELPSMRGFYSKQTAVFIDGARLPKDLTGTNDLSILPISFFDKAELVKGGLSPVYGPDAEGGAISFSLKEPRPGASQASIYSSAGSFKEKMITARSGFGRENFSLINSVAYLRSDGFQENSSYEKKEVSALATKKLSPSLKMRFTAFSVDSQRGVPSGTPVDISLWDGEKEKKANTSLNKQKDTLLWGSLGVEKKFEDSSIFARFSGSSLYTSYRHYDSGSSSETASKILSDIFDGGWRKGGFELGFEASRSRLFSFSYGDKKISYTALRTSMKTDIGKGFYLAPSMRLDDNKRYTDQFSPGLAIVWEQSYEWKASAKFSRSWQAPTFADMYSDPNAPNENLHPERSYQSEFSIERRGKEGIRSWLSLYYTDIKDRIALLYPSWKAYNIDKAFNSGLETGISAVVGYFELSGSLSLVRARGKSSGEGSYGALPYISFAKAVSSIAFKRDNFSSIFSGRFSSARWSGRDHSGVKMPQYYVYDISLSYKIGQAMLTLGCYNLFDERYALNADLSNGYYPSDPRTFRAGINIPFL